MLMGMRASRRREEERYRKWKASLPRCESCGQIIYPPKKPMSPEEERGLYIAIGLMVCAGLVYIGLMTFLTFATKH